MYGYVNAYNVFLKFKSLENNKCTQTSYEIAVYIADDLELAPHKHFEKGINHVRLQPKYSTDGINFPKDIGIAKIAKTICEYSPEYQVGEYDTPVNPIIHASIPHLYYLGLY